MSFSIYPGIRVLVKTDKLASADEFIIVELSPCGEWVKLQDRAKREVWHEMVKIEFLAQLLTLPEV